MRAMTSEGMLEAAVRPWQEREPGLWARVSLWVASRGKPIIGSARREHTVRVQEGGALPRTIDPETQHCAIDPLDSDLLEFLEERDQRLYAIMSMATAYRAILNQVRPNWIGHDPEIARAVLSRWQGTIQEIQRLAAEL